MENGSLFFSREGRTNREILFSQVLIQIAAALLGSPNRRETKSTASPSAWQAKQWKRLSTFILGFLSLWNGQTAIPLRPTRIPYSSAACLVVTFCLTASNTFITSSFRETKKGTRHFHSENGKCLLKFHILFFLFRCFLHLFLFLLFLLILQAFFERVLRLWLLLNRLFRR